MGNVVSRREFLKFTGGVAAGAAAVPGTAQAATPAQAGRVTLPYPSKSLGKAGGMTAGLCEIRPDSSDWPVSRPVPWRLAVSAGR